MFFCILKLNYPEENVSKEIIQQLKITVKSNFDRADRVTFFNPQMMLILTQLETHCEIREKLIYTRDHIYKKYGASLTLTCGFAEVKDGDILNAVGAAKQMLSRTSDDHPISGMYYHRFAKI